MQTREHAWLEWRSRGERNKKSGQRVERIRSRGHVQRSWAFAPSQQERYWRVMQRKKPGLINIAAWIRAVG